MAKPKRGTGSVTDIAPERPAKKGRRRKILGQFFNPLGLLKWHAKSLTSKK